jgi:signal transduction histidine kinase
MAAERGIQEERLALLSVLQELTVAALDLFDPRRPMTAFLERIAERLSCVAVLVLEESEPSSASALPAGVAPEGRVGGEAPSLAPALPARRLLGAAGLSAASAAMPIEAGPDGSPHLPYPELARPLLITWSFALVLDEAPVGCGRRVSLLLCFEGEPQFAPQYRGMMRRLVSILTTALLHRELYARTIESGQERARHLAREQAGRAAAEQAQRRAAFLAEASRRLSTSLNYETTLTRVARLPVPYVADWCIVDVLEGEGMLRRAVVVHADPGRSDLARQLQRAVPLDAVTPASVSCVLRTGEALLWERAAEAAPRLMGVASPEDAAILEQLGFERFVSVPLISRGTTLGVLTIVSGRDGLRYGPAEVTLAEELGRRAALALDNARLYDSAQRAIRAREDLVAVVSHDLKNPLATIFMNVNLLARKLPPALASELMNPVDRIKRAADRMERLIRDLLDLARLDAGHLAIEPAPEEPSALVGDALELLHERAAEKSLRLDQHVPSGLPQVRCDHERILQVISNLVGNAIKFTPAGGEIEVRAEALAEEVLFAVRDTGPGIAEEQIAWIFNRYYQPKQTPHHGSGLGLFIAKGLVELHGGRIWVDSKIGEGSTFYFTLPAAGVRHG